MNFHTNRVLLICSTGGHLTQMLKLNKSLGQFERILVTELSESSLSIDESQFYKLLYLPHGGREEGFRYVFKFLFNCIVSFIRYTRYRPKVVISTGAHTAVPLLLIAKLFGSRIIFIETFAKINSPSLTGRLAYKLSDSFYVQWPELRKFYPKSKYKGKIY